MGASQRRKGLDGEREFARLIGGKRVPLSGAAGGEFSGDVVDSRGWRWEVKRRRNGWQELYKWLDGADVLAVRADRRPWLVVMPLDRFLDLTAGDKGGGLDGREHPPGG